jgi:hypothetical protein
MTIKLSAAQVDAYLDEIRAFLAWVGEQGFDRMAMIFRMALPSVQTDAQGAQEVRTSLDVIRREGLTPDAGVVTIELLIQAGEHLREFGAPVPSHEAVTHLAAGRLGHGGESLL